MSKSQVSVGKTLLKNPLIAGSAEHLIEAGGVRRALRAGVGAVVVKSTNELERGRDQLQRAEYMLLDDEWREIAWTPNAPSTAFFACRSGLTPQSFEAWLDQTAQLDREAKSSDAYAIASLIVADLAQTVAMAKQIEPAGIRVAELHIGTPYSSPPTGVVSTELDPERVAVIVSAVRQAIDIPLWVKITGQSERVPDLAAAAFRSGGEAVVMAGRLLGFIPDVETLHPFLGTTLGVGGYWNLPLTCHWLAASRGSA
jgi:dihydroorotate dehydrogenase (NAD+) catalytic subunit